MQQTISNIIERSIKTKGFWIDLDNDDMVEKYLVNICKLRCTDVNDMFEAYRSAVDNIDLASLRVKKYYVKTSYGVDIFFARRKSVVVDYIAEHYVNKFGNKLPYYNVKKLVVSD